MAKAQVKRIRERLEQIKVRASEENAKAKTGSGVTGHQLAEEAAGLGLELADLMEEAK
jgi:hypothetical protein